MRTMPKPLPMLWTFDEVLAVLGGSKAIAKICHTAPNAATTWRTSRGKFPAKYYFSMKGALRDKGYRAPISLWGFHSSAELFKGPKPKKALNATTESFQRQAAARRQTSVAA
jgi:hypothetical protein